VPLLVRPRRRAEVAEEQPQRRERQGAELSLDWRRARRLQVVIFRVMQLLGLAAAEW
jgi:hypothetical protein